MSARLCRHCLAVQSGDVVIHDPECQTQGISPAQPSERAQQMLVHATVAARGEANHHEIRQLREKVEALEAHELVILKNMDRVLAVLDAALKRIELLERDMHDVHPNALSGAKP